MTARLKIAAYRDENGSKKLLDLTAKQDYSLRFSEEKRSNHDGVAEEFLAFSPPPLESLEPRPIVYVRYENDIDTMVAMSEACGLGGRVPVYRLWLFNRRGHIVLNPLSYQVMAQVYGTSCRLRIEHLDRRFEYFFPLMFRCKVASTDDIDGVEVKVVSLHKRYWRADYIVLWSLWTPSGMNGSSVVPPMLLASGYQEREQIPILLSFDSGLSSLIPVIAVRYKRQEVHSTEAAASDSSN